jgi:hypothetical protein
MFAVAENRHKTLQTGRVTERQDLSAIERVRTPELDILDELEPALKSRVRGYADRVTAIQSFVGEAAARRAEGTGSPSFVQNMFAGRRASVPVTSTRLFLTASLVIYIAPIAAWLWFGSPYRWWGYVLVGFGVAYCGMGVEYVLWLMAPESPPTGLPTVRRLLVLAATSAALTAVVVWRGEHPGMWEVITVEGGLFSLPCEIGVTLQRRRGVQGQLDQLQTLALDLVDLLHMVNRAALEGANPPETLVKQLEVSAKRALAASERTALRWRSERQVWSWIRGSGGSVAAGLRWHKRLVIMPAADASAELFTSFGYGLAAAAAGDWKSLMFESAPSAAQSFWQRYRGRLAVAVVLGAVTAATYAFPHLLASADETRLRGLLMLTAVFSLISSPTDTFGRAYDALGNLFSASGITPRR